MTLRIPCPKCGAELKLPDRSLLGKTGKCPKCGHRFTLAEPDEVELELAPPIVEEPVRIATARRVGETSAETSDTAAGSFPVFADSPAGEPAAAAPRRLHRRKKRGRRTEVIIGGIVALAAAGVLWAAVDFARRNPAPKKLAGREPPKQNAVYLSERDRLEKTAALILADSPTRGEPISLRYVPAGASIVFHLRPTDLWKDGGVAEEVRYCLAPLTKWAAEQIERHCLLPPNEIEEATICLLLGARGSDPMVATAVRPAPPKTRSELLAKFGHPQPKPGESVYVGAERAFLFGDEVDGENRPLVFAIAPAPLAGDLALSASGPGLTSDSIEALLAHTDRQRDFTVVFQPEDLRIHEDSLAGDSVEPFWNRILDQLGPDTEAAAWSVHLAGSDFYSELFLRNDPTQPPGQFHGKATRRLESLPAELVEAVSRMNPAEVGDRKLIGRLPAMVRLFAEATNAGMGDRYVVLQTRLPERAGPNLALAGLLAWNESTRTDFTKKPADSPGSTAAPTATLAERLKKPIEIDFRRTPLEEAFAYLGAETGVEFEIDGDALKLAGYTRNMPQTFALGNVPAEKAIAELLKPPQDKLAVILDEAIGKAFVTTKAAAEDKGLTPATFTP